MFGNKRVGGKGKPEQYDKMMTGYRFAVGDIERMVKKLDELPDNGLPVIKFGRTPFTLKELRQRFSDHRDKIDVSKAEIDVGTANYRTLANEMDRAAKDITKVCREFKIKNSEAAVGCLFVWAVLDTQADKDQGISFAQD